MRESAEWQLDRIDPPSRRGEEIPLQASVGRYLLGRSRVCNVPLYTATASRQHAEVWRRDDGEWMVAPLADKRVLADGEALNGECELCEGLSLVMGGDELRCRRPTQVVEFDVDGEQAALAYRTGPSRRVVWGFAGAVAILAALAAAWGIL